MMGSDMDEHGTANNLTYASSSGHRCTWYATIADDAMATSCKTVPTMGKATNSLLRLAAYHPTELRDKATITYACASMAFSLVLRNTRLYCATIADPCKSPGIHNACVCMDKYELHHVSDMEMINGLNIAKRNPGGNRTAAETAIGGGGL